MTDSNQAVNQADNSQQAASSAPVADQEVKAVPPAESNSAPESLGDQRVPYERFKEVNEERKQLERRLEDLERSFQERENSRVEVDPISRAKSRFMSEAGLDEKSASTVADIVRDIAQSSVDRSIAPLEEQANAISYEQMVEGFAKANPDFRSLEPKMIEYYESLPKKDQVLLANSQSGLGLIYEHVKYVNSQDELNKREQKGKEEGYKTKQMKMGMASVPSTPANSSGSELTRESIRKMSLDEYKKRESEIWAAADKGLIK